MKKPISTFVLARALALMVVLPAHSQTYNFTTVAGLASNGGVDGTGSSPSFNNPTGVAVDSAGNVYVADNGNSTIRLGTRFNEFPPIQISRFGVQTIVSWDTNATGLTLQTSATLAPGSWSNYSGTINNNTVSNLPTSGSLFFRFH